MKGALKYLKVSESFDIRQPSKVLHKVDEIIGISLFAMIADANDSEEIEAFGKEHENILNFLMESHLMIQ